MQKRSPDTMPRKSNLFSLILLLLCVALTVGGILSLTAKPHLFYPEVQDRRNYEFFEDDFLLVTGFDMFPNGNCGAGKGDFVALIYGFTQEDENYTPGRETLEKLAESIAGQGAYVVVFTSDINLSYRYHGTVYMPKNGEIQQRTLFARTGEDFSKALCALADRSTAAYLLVAAFLLFLYLPYVGARLLNLLREPGESADALLRMTRGRYVVSLIAAVLVLLITLAWLIAPNLYMVFENRLERGALYVSLVSLPFLLCAESNIINLTWFRRYRRWLNILCLVVATILYGFLAFSLVMMALQ